MKDATIESVAKPDTATPTHLHLTEEEHFLVLSGHYRIAIGDDIVNAEAGARVTIPPPEKLAELSAEFNCVILGPPSV